MRFVSFSAAVAGMTDYRRVLREARDLRRSQGQTTVLCIDEAHRLSAEEQDLLLAMMEDHDVVVIAATNRPPQRALAEPLLSRATPYRFQRLSPDELRHIYRRAVENESVELEPGIEDYLVHQSEGDARALLNAIERLSLGQAQSDEPLRIEQAVERLSPGGASYEGGADNHHDVVTAFVKSMRGSDPNATLLWLARMLEAGEESRFIAQRIVVSAAEDVGLADPFALVLAQAVCQAVESVPATSARALLSEAALYVATAPKSASAVRGLQKAERDVAGKRPPVPIHLRHRTLRGSPEPGYGQGATSESLGGFLFRQYLPDALTTQVYFEPGNEGLEPRLRERLSAWWPEKY